MPSPHTTSVTPPPPNAALTVATRGALAVGAIMALAVSAALGWGAIRLFDALDQGGSSGWDGGLLDVAFALFLGAGVALVSYIGLCTLTVWTVVHDSNRRGGPLLAMIIGPLVLALLALQAIAAV